MQKTFEGCHYKVIRNLLSKNLLDSFERDIDKLVKEFKIKEEDVFRTKEDEYKSIKQIQNCHNYSILPFQQLIKELLFLFPGKVLNQQYFIKLPKYKITSPHQDGAYFEDPSKPIITCWIPLDDVNEQNSCLQYYCGQYDSKIIPHKEIGSVIRTRTGKTGKSMYLQETKEDDFEPAIMKYGDLVLHDQFAIHYAGINSTKQKRIAVTTIIQLTNSSILDQF